jgi:hypothetical protein
MAVLPMPPHVQTAYKVAVDNIIFHKRQQTAEERAGLSLLPEAKPFLSQWIISGGFVAVSFIGAALTLIYLFSVR